MRKLENHDLFLFLRVANTVGIKEEVLKIANEVKKNGKNVTAESVGVDFIFNLLAKCGDPTAEKTIYEFLSGILEVSVDELYHGDPLTLMKQLKEYTSLIEVEEWKAFFTSLVGLMK